MRLHKSTCRRIFFSPKEAPEVIQALLALPQRDQGPDYIFRVRTGGSLDPDNVKRAFSRHLALALLPDIRFHDLRHSHVGLLIAAGVHPKAIQARLGHASITTALNTYGHLMPATVAGIGRRVSAILNGNSEATEGVSKVTEALAV